jgi:hypothetical protein
VKADFQLLVGACYNLSCLLFILPKNKSLALSSVRHVESMYVSKPSSQDQIRKLARWGMFCGTFNQVAITHQLARGEGAHSIDYTDCVPGRKSKMHRFAYNP